MTQSNLKRALVVIPAYEPSRVYQGPINSTKKLISFLLKKRDCAVDVITSNFIAPGKYAALPFPDGLSNEDERLRLMRYRTLFSYNTSAVCPSAIWPVAIASRRADWICVVGYYEFLSLAGVFFGAMWGKPILWNTTGALLPDQCQRKSSRKKRLVTFLYQRLVKPELLTFLAKSTQEELAIKALFPESRVALVPNSIPDWLALNVPNQRAGGVKILFAGRISRVKRIEYLVEALRSLKGMTWHCVIAGVVQDQEYLSELRNLIRDYGLSEHVTIELQLDQAALQILYNSADIFVLPSISENFGMAALESAACGAFPVLSVGVGFGTALNEIDSQSLRLFSRVNELVDILFELMGNIEKVRGLVDRRKLLVNQHFGARKEEELLEDAFSDFKGLN